ncbi:tRNA uridine-5-carboxymethylaminomethyl(34) synthesis enzyme MnmG [symbiont of Argiope bruennichi]|uniref:tRNA uridine-5-carboxymethylaminomethyl(34) synthesis enzyme MnmG n=1 Tax=symbiont of Argiope bruennichi TaxID=2810479 RepID=UPI003DA6C432
MINNKMFFDVIVVGGGHAGVEAANICAKKDCKTLLITFDPTKIAMTPCNPAIGGSAKGIVVKEIDALGGIMGKAADATYLQFKMLNESKGISVHSLRAQIDKKSYPEFIQNYLKNLKNLTILADEVLDFLIENNKIVGIKAKKHKNIMATCVVVTTGTYLKAIQMYGKVEKNEGPEKTKINLTLSDKLKKLGFKILRFKTGTPPRLDYNTIDFSKFEVLNSGKNCCYFSFLREKEKIVDKNINCYVGYTNKKTEEIILKNLHKSPMFQDRIKGIGPRYCPSIEDKVARFKNREKHQFFLEPETKDYKSVYIQGFSSSLPEEIQLLALRSIDGLENCVPLRYGFAIEYDCIDPQELFLTLESKKIENLFFAGQINGTSGYEEAAGQGIIAGINVFCKIKNLKPFILQRNESYIGIMIDDLCNKGVLEPYRLLSSRAEFRLFLRVFNADLRMYQKSKEWKLLEDNELLIIKQKKDNIENTLNYLKNTLVSPKEINEFLARFEEKVTKKFSLFDLLKRPKINIFDLFNYLKINYENLSRIEMVEVETLTKYDGYFKKQADEWERMQKFEKFKLNKNFDYYKVNNLSIEAKEKLTKIKPETIGQAFRISGINPSDIVGLFYYFKNKKKSSNLLKKD